eukprot:TRINITY_DN40248_c0_g2_i2.p1 TRINITY_DN40248_c0_g2~~TRINITY_DN40248_c0_g2_i2.p1  ORF type:complete len:123 (-),score=13.89 TRINITY_DN40248_c0_g2_i2:38-361(-)
MAVAVSLIQIDINDALNAFNNCIREAAECMKKHIGCKEQYENRDWFDAECNFQKKLVRRLLNKFRRTLEDEDRHTFCKARREYKHLLNMKRKQFNDSLLNENKTNRL